MLGQVNVAGAADPRRSESPPHAWLVEVSFGQEGCVDRGQPVEAVFRGALFARLATPRVASQAARPAQRRDRYPAVHGFDCDAGPKRVLLAAPRGYCAGVDRAVQTVERGLDLYGAPVYVRKEIVHNKHVVEQLAKRGAIFVEQETEVPEGERRRLLRPRRRPRRSRERRRPSAAHDRCQRYLPAGHQGPRRGASLRRSGRPSATRLATRATRRLREPRGSALIDIVGADTVEEVGVLEAAIASGSPSITQTTWSMILLIRSPPCAPGSPPLSAPSPTTSATTTNRQIAIKQLAHECDLVLVIGSTNSSNSNRRKRWRASTAPPPT